MSHAEGYGTIAKSNFQHVEGQYNIEDSTNKYAHIVGNGSGNARSNAHTLDWDGNAWYQGNVYVGGTSQDDASQLATTTFVEEKVAALVNSAPETLDTLGELADAMKNNADAIDALQEIAGNKADANHTHNTQSIIYNGATSHNDKSFSKSDNLTAVIEFIDEDIANVKSTKVDKSSFDAHTAAHAPSDAQANVIESIKVNGTAQTISSKSVNITVPTKASDIGAATDDHTHTVDSALSSSSTNPVENKVVNSAIVTLTSAVGANTDSITAHSTAISNLQTAIEEIEEVTSAEIQALFSGTGLEIPPGEGDDLPDPVED